MESLQLLKEIEAWLCFNTEPPKEEIAKLRKSINDHVTEQLNLQDTIDVTEALIEDIILVARHKDRGEFSMSKAGVEADKFITRLRERLS